MLTPKRKAHFILSSIVFFISIISVLFTISLYNLDTSYEDKGLIIDKFNSDKLDVAKHSSDISTHLYLVVNFDRGKIEQVDVSADTWYRYNKGQRITFIKHKQVLDSVGGFFEVILLIIGDIIAIIYVICLIVCSFVFIYRQFSDDTDKGFWE